MYRYPTPQSDALTIDLFGIPSYAAHGWKAPILPPSFTIRFSGYCIRIAYPDKRVSPSISYNAEYTKKFHSRVPQHVNYAT